MEKDLSGQVDENQLATLPKWAQDLIRIQGEMIKELQQEVAKMKSQIGRNSKNSSLPPSSDRFGSKPSPQKVEKTGKRKRGGQKGHKKNERPRLETDDIHNVILIACAHCGEKLEGVDPKPSVHQWVELPEIQPEVVEFILHKLKCSKCGKATQGQVPEEKRESYGPRLQAFVSQATGQYRFTKRTLALLFSEIFHIPISIATICNLQGKMAEMLKPAMAEIDASIQESNLPLNIDETGFRNEAKKGLAWFAGNQEASRIRLEERRNRKCLYRLIGDFDGVITSDRYSVYKFWPDEKWQICWAHLLRDFLAVKEDRNTWSSLGDKLLKEGLRMLKLWKKVRKGRMLRQTFELNHLPEIQERFKAFLNQGKEAHPMRVGALSRDLLKHWDALWTFARTEGVEPTNNEAERQLRALVMYRKVSQGTHSAKGSLFIETIFSVLDTCRKQGNKALGFLTKTVRAVVMGKPVPSIMAPV